MTRGLLSNRDELVVLFDDLAEGLTRSAKTVDIVMVGGSWMLWHSHRTATRDVVSARRFETDLSEAIGRVAGRRQLRAEWLNDSAAAFWPANASHDKCEVVYQNRTLVVRTPSPDVIFSMKLYRADPQDREDLIILWPLCGFATPEAAAGAFRLAYPHAPADEHLADFIADIAADAGA